MYNGYGVIIIVGVIITENAGHAYCARIMKKKKISLKVIVCYGMSFELHKRERYFYHVHLYHIV